MNKSGDFCWILGRSGVACPIGLRVQLTRVSWAWLHTCAQWTPTHCALDTPPSLRGIIISLPAPSLLPGGPPVLHLQSGSPLAPAKTTSMSTQVYQARTTTQTFWQHHQEYKKWCYWLGMNVWNFPRHLWPSVRQWQLKPSRSSQLPGLSIQNAWYCSVPVTLCSIVVWMRNNLISLAPSLLLTSSKQVLAENNNTVWSTQLVCGNFITNPYLTQIQCVGVDLSVYSLRGGFQWCESNNPLDS